MLSASSLHSSALFIFHGATPISYVQAAILNLSHPYLRSTIVLLDKGHTNMCAYLSRTKRQLLPYTVLKTTSTALISLIHYYCPCIVLVQVLEY